MALVSPDDIIRYKEWNIERPSYIETYKRAKEKMREQINSFNTSQAKILEDTLNKIITNASFNEEVVDSVFSKLSSIIDQGVEKGIEISTSLKVSTEESKEAWKNYGMKTWELKKQGDMTAQQIRDNDDVKKLLSIALSAQGKINSIQGEAFEALLQELLPLITDNASNLTNEKIEEILAQLKKNMIKIEGAIKTEGSKKRAVQTQIDAEKTVFSSGKVDVITKAPFLDPDFPLQISAKNYSSLRDLSVLSGANVTGLVSSWPEVSEEARSHFYNALTVWEAPEDILVLGRALFFIQALVGTTQEEAKAGCLIVNIARSKQHPIRVLSLPDLIKEGLDNNSFQRFVTFKFKPELQLYKTGEERTPREEVVNRINSLKLNIKLSRQKIYANHLRNKT